MKATELKVGDVIVIRGTAARDPAVHEIARIRQVRRVNDGWQWVQDWRGQTITPANKL